jgi:hypothetical protein
LQLRGIPKADPITLHPGLADIYARKVANLAEALNAEDTKAEAADILRGLIDKLIPTPDPTAPGGHKIELFGELGAILSLCDNGMAANVKTRTVVAGVSQMTMVAGADSLQCRKTVFLAGGKFITPREKTDLLGQYSLS